jgi:hypothetical protein
MNLTSTSYIIRINSNVYKALNKYWQNIWQVYNTAGHDMSMWQHDSLWNLLHKTEKSPIIRIAMLFSLFQHHINIFKRHTLCLTINRHSGPLMKRILWYDDWWFNKNHFKILYINYNNNKKSKKNSNLKNYL